MVKAKAHDIKANLKKLDSKYSAVLIFGKDEGLVRERSDIFSKQVVADLSDPFNVVSPSPEELKETPSRLVDEVSSMSLMGGRRLIRFDGAGDTNLTALDDALKAKMGDNFLCVTAGDLKPTAKIRKLFEGAANALAVPCYTDGAGDLHALVQEVLSGAGLTADHDATQYLISNIGSDRLVSRSELEKIIMFKLGDENKQVSLEDVRTLVGDSAAMALSDIALAVASGDMKKLDTLIDRASIQGENAIAILRSVSRQLNRLYIVRGAIDEGTNADQAMSKLRPPIFFKEKDSFRAQLQKWSSGKLIQALAVLLKAELDCKTTGLPDNAIAARTCARLAGSVARR
jgi:DNA polymerase-3 subunit delta